VALSSQQRRARGRRAPRYRRSGGAGHRTRHVPPTASIAELQRGRVGLPRDGIRWRVRRSLRDGAHGARARGPRRQHAHARDRHAGPVAHPVAQKHRSVRHAAQLQIVRLRIEQDGTSTAARCVQRSTEISLPVLLCPPPRAIFGLQMRLGARASRPGSRANPIARDRRKGRRHRGSAYARDTHPPRFIPTTRAPNLALVAQKIDSRPTRHT